MSPESDNKVRCISLVLCNTIYRDEATKNLVLAGTFNNIGARSVPCLHPQMAVLVTLLGGGVHDLQIIIVEKKTGKEIADFKNQQLSLGERSDETTTDINVMFSDLVFPDLGSYTLVFKVDGEVVQSRPFRVSLVSPEGAV